MERFAFFQLNLHHSRAATANLAVELMQATGYVALLQEPWTVAGAPRGFKGCGEVFYSRGTLAPRACIVAGPGIKAWFLPQFSNRDMVTVRVEEAWGNGRPLIVSSVYMANEEGAVVPLPLLDHLVGHCQEQNVDICIGMDSNSHHTAWGSTNINARGESLLEFLVRTNLVICNLGAVPTFRTAARSEVLDITLISYNLSLLVGNWRVVVGTSLSDHELIRWDLGEIEFARQKTRNIRKTDWTRYVGEVFSKLRGIPVRNVTSPLDLDGYTRDVTEAILASFRRSCRESGRRKGGGKPAWPPELKELQRQARRAQRRAYNTGDPVDWERKRECQREFKRELRRFQQSSWRQYCTEMERLPPVARLVKLMKQDSMVQVGMLQREDGQYTSTPEEALDLLLAEHFSDVGDNQVTDWGAERGPLSLAEVERIVTRRRIEYALHALEPFKSPGPDGLYPILLQKAEGALLPHLLGIFRASLRFGFVPRLWRQTRVVSYS